MNFVVVGIVTSIVLTGVNYIASQNLLTSLFIFLITNAFFVLIVKRQMHKNQLKTHRYHQCFQFINTFIISLNVKGSMNAAMQSSYETTDEDTKEIIDSIIIFIIIIMISNIYQSLHKIFCRVFSRVVLIIELVCKKPSTHTCYKYY